MRDRFYQDNGFLQGVNSVVEALLQESSVQGVYEEWEQRGIVGRLDEKIWPQVFRTATVSAGEFDLLRKIEKVVRLGRVKAVHAQHIEMERGQLKLEPNTLLVDCTANGLAGYQGSYNIFSERHIRLSLSLSGGNSSHASACIAHLEATIASDADKNTICEPAAMSFPTRLEGKLTDYIDILYAHFKTHRAFQKRLRSALFHLKSRTNIASPAHYSLLAMLWTLHGPTQLDNKISRFIHKIEHVGFVDYPPKEPSPKDRLTIIQWLGHLFCSLKLTLGLGNPPSRVGL